MFFLVLRYLLATPFALLWAVCVIGNAWMLVATLTPHGRKPYPEPVPFIGAFCGLIAAALIPHHLAWWVMGVLILLPEFLGGLLAILGLAGRSEPTPPRDGRTA